MDDKSYSHLRHSVRVTCVYSTVPTEHLIGKADVRILGTGGQQRGGSTER